VVPPGLRLSPNKAIIPVVAKRDQSQHVYIMKKVLCDTNCFFIGTNSQWQGFVNVVMKQTFPSLIRYWLDEVDIPSVVIKYEDMLTDLASQVKKMLDFLQVSYTKEDIDCVTNGDFNSFLRIHKSDFDPYTPGLKKLVISGMKDVEPILNKHSVSYQDVIEQNNG